MVKLREMVVAVEAEGGLLSAENLAIKDTLSKANISELPSRSLNRQSTDFMPPSGLADFQTPQNWQYSSNSTSSANTQVSIDFDQLLDAPCIHVDRSNSFGDAYNQPLEPHPPVSRPPKVSTFANITVPPTYTQPNPSAFKVMTPSQSDMAVNFILA